MPIIDPPVQHALSASRMARGSGSLPDMLYAVTLVNVNGTALALRIHARYGVPGIYVIGSHDPPDLFCSVGVPHPQNARVRGSGFVRRCVELVSVFTF